MRRHHRCKDVEQAKLDFAKAFLAVEEKYGLTFGELFLILGEKMERLSRNLVQSERHPDDPEKSPDVE